MPPKQAAPAAVAAPARPQSQNDMDLARTENELTQISVADEKWKQRQGCSTDETLKNYHHQTVVETCIQACEKLVKDLDKSVERLLPNKAAELDAAVPKTDDKKKDKGQAGSVPPPSQYKTSDINDMTDLLLRFYRFDAGIVRRDTDPPLLVTNLKKLARSALTELEVVDAANLKPVLSRAKSAVHYIDLSKDLTAKEPKPGDESDGEGGSGAGASSRPASTQQTLSCPPGFDPGVWADVMQLRARRLQVADAIAFLEKEKTPVMQRKAGLGAMADLTQYALGAFAHKRGILQALLKEREALRSEENAAWLDKQGAPSSSPGGAAAKK